MNYLLDVNVLVSWGWNHHLEHQKVIHWLLSIQNKPTTKIYTSSIVQLGFIRVSLHQSRGFTTIQEASNVLAGMLQGFRKQHTFLSDHLPAENFPPWCKSPNQITDAHLLRLAESHDAKLATLDQKIPGAFLIPII
jgi:predicted nucleic acid-binding protein